MSAPTSSPQPKTPGDKAVTPDIESWLLDFARNIQKAADLLQSLKNKAPVESETSKAVASGVAWLKLTDMRLKVKQQIADLKGWGAPEAANFDKAFGLVESKAAARDYDGAAAGLRALQKHVASAHARHQAQGIHDEEAEAFGEFLTGTPAWDELTGQRKAVRKQIGELAGRGKKTEADGFLVEWTALEKQAADGDPKGAAAKFPDLQDRVENLHKSTPAVPKVKPGGGLTDDVVGGLHDLEAAEWDKLAAERKAVRKQIGELVGRGKKTEADAFLTEWKALEKQATDGDPKGAADAFAGLKTRVGQLHTATPTVPKTALGQTTPPQVAEDIGALWGEGAKTRYFKLLKKEQIRIKTIDRAIAADAYGTPPPDAVKSQKEAFETTRAAVVAAQNADKYDEALGKLKELVKVMGALEKARLKELESALNGAITAGMVKNVVGKLQPNEITALGPEKQVNLLKILRTTTGWICSKCNQPWSGMDCSVSTCTGGTRMRQPISEDGTPDLFEARCKLYDNMSMQPEFVKQDKEFRANVVKEFEGDATFEQAKKDWATLDKTKRFEFLTYAAKKQCAVMGQPEPDVFPNDTLPPRTCSNDIFTCTGVVYECNGTGHPDWDGSESDSGSAQNYRCQRCGTVGKIKSNKACRAKTWGYVPGDRTDCPTCGQPSVDDAEMCGAVWPVVGKIGTCSTCGGVDTAGGVTFGGCDVSLLNGKPKSKIGLNPSSNVIGDFEETFNTIMHENAHNYQLYLVKRYRDDRDQLFIDVPYAREIEAQIQMWDENVNGYVPSGPTYDKQPLEDHAWKFGNKVAARKLRPKKKSMDIGHVPEGVAPLT
jgi:hypothetical protein